MDSAIEACLELTRGRPAAVHDARAHAEYTAPTRPSIHAASCTVRQAAHRGMSSICKLVVENGVDVGAKSDDGITALIAAASEGHADIVELLLGEAKAEPDAKDKARVQHD